MTPDEMTRVEHGAFVERVMTAIAVLPEPTPTRTFVTAIRRRSAGDAMAALSVAWHLGTERSWHIAPRVRARSMALVLAVVAVLGTGSLAAAAAVRTVAPQIVRAPVVQPVGSDAGGQRPDPGEPDGERPGASLDTTIGTGSAEPADTDLRPTPGPTPGVPALKTDHVGAGSTGVKAKNGHEDHESVGAEPSDGRDDKGSGDGHDPKGPSGAQATAEPGERDHAGAIPKPGDGEVGSGGD